MSIQTPVRDIPGSHFRKLTRRNKIKCGPA